MHHIMRFSTPRPFARLATTVALAGTLGLAGGAAALAQDATPAGTPIGPDASCVAPAMAAADTGAATAAASPAAAAELPEGTPVEDQAIVDEATGFVQNLYACYTAGDGESFAGYFTDAGLQAAYGTADREAVAAQIAAVSSQAPAGDVTVDEVLDYGDGSYGVSYQVKLGKQLVHNTDVIVPAGDSWQVDNRVSTGGETDMDSATASIKASVDGGSVVIEVSPAPVMNQPAVKFQFTNNADSAAHVVIVQGGDAASVTSADVTALPEGSTFIGEAWAAPGEIAGTTFEELEEGAYVVVVETANGETGSFDLTIDPPFDPNA
jgi:hypothetical protein